MSFISGTIGAVLGNNAAKKAASAQKQAAVSAQNHEREMFDKGISLIEPSIQMGDRARNALAFNLGLAERPIFYDDQNALTDGQLDDGIQVVPGAATYGWQDITRGRDGQDSFRQYGVTGTGPEQYQAGGNVFATRDDARNFLRDTSQSAGPGFQYQGYAKTPGYDFRFNEGMKGLNRSRAAAGSLDSGATQKAALRYAQDFAANEYGTHLNRLAALSGAGQTASQNAFAGYQNQGNALANLQTQFGNAQAAGTIGGANAINQGLSSFSQGLGQVASIFGGL